MLTEKFHDVLTHEGVVAIVSDAAAGPHLVNTWNSYIVVTDDERLLIPAYAMRKTEKNTIENPNIIISVGSKSVTGYKDYPGTGFIIRGTGKFLNNGPEYDMMKAKFTFLTRVLEVTVESCKQML